MIINFSTILFSIFNIETNILLILSIFTLSFSVVCDTRIYENILEKLIYIYEEEIIFEIKKYIRDYNQNRTEGENIDVIYDIQRIEKKNKTFKNVFGRFVYASYDIEEYRLEKILSYSFYLFIFIQHFLHKMTFFTKEK